MQTYPSEHPAPFWRRVGSYLTISTLAVLPFIMMETFRARTPMARFPFPLFVVMLLLFFSFTAIAAPLVQGVMRGEKTVISSSVLARAALLIVVGFLLISLVVDQMPCFLGATNCD